MDIAPSDATPTEGASTSMTERRAGPPSVKTLRLFELEDAIRDPREKSGESANEYVNDIRALIHTATGESPARTS